MDPQAHDEFDRVGRMLSGKDIPVMCGIVSERPDAFDRMYLDRYIVSIQPWGPMAYPQDQCYSIPVAGLRENGDDIDDLSGATALGCSLAAVVLYLGRLWPDRPRGPTSEANWQLARHGLDSLRNCSSPGKWVDVSRISQWVERYYEKDREADHEADEADHEVDEVDYIYKKLYETLYGGFPRL